MTKITKSKKITYGNIRKNKKGKYTLGVKRNGKNTSVTASKKKQTAKGKAMDRKRSSKTQITITQRKRGFAHVGDTKSERKYHGSKYKNFEKVNNSLPRFPRSKTI